MKGNLIDSRDAGAHNKICKTTEKEIATRFANGANTLKGVGSVFDLSATTNSEQRPVLV